MELFLASCRGAASAVAEDYAIVVKLHPVDVNCVDYSDLMQRYPDVIFLRDYPANTLIKNASLVITINSTVGVEALIHCKPVITLGQNFYNVPDVVYHVENLSDLPRAIASSLSSPPEKDKIRRLLYYLYHQYFAHGSWKDYSPKSIKAVAGKMSSLLTSVD
jgi:capsular polysaccharide export protein